MEEGNDNYDINDEIVMMEKGKNNQNINNLIVMRGTTRILPIR